MKKLFISQPMRGKTDEEIIAERQRIKEKVSDIIGGEDFQEIASFIDDRPDVEKNNMALYYLGQSLMLLSDADIVYFCDGWRDARGCSIEHEACTMYGIKIIRD